MRLHRSLRLADPARRWTPLRGAVPSQVRMRASALATVLAGALLAGAAAGPAWSAFLFPLQPDWESDPLDRYGTGCAFRDLDGDDLPDLIVANGNDMARQTLVVYRNQGGTLPAQATWSASDVDYHGHLDLADVDGDGALDCAVAVYIGAAGFSAPGRVKLYRGNGDGTFSSTPVWTSQASFYCFSVAFGDANGDGRPDLACAAGEPYERRKETYRVYRNVGGTLEATPYWQSAQTKLGIDVTWGDINGDGRLDLVFAGGAKATGADPVNYPNEVYFGDGATFPTTPSWQSTDPRYLANTIAVGDLNGDGWNDVAVADNRQTGSAGDGRFKVYLNNGVGQLATTPNWTSSFDGYGSHVSFADADGDGDLDLAAGSWWGPVRIYENQAGTLPTTPAWQSTATSVVENVVWEDVDNSDLAAPALAVFTGDGMRKLFDTGRRPIRVREVRVGGVPLGPAEYFAATEAGWIALGAAPAPGAEVRIRFAVAAAPDFAVSNWDPEVGDFLYRNDGQAGGAADLAAGLDGLRAVPNPATRATRLELGTRPGQAAEIEILAADGTRVRHGRADGGFWWWDGADGRGRSVPAGVYFARVRAAGLERSERIVIVR